MKCDQFHESLLIRPLEDGSLFTELKFNVITRYSDLDDMFYHLFPKSIGQLFTRLPIWQFDLTLTRGRWNYENWGSFHSNIAPYGAELHAVFYNNNTITNNIESEQQYDDEESCIINNTKTEYNNEWLIFQQILSGLYCASINEVNIQIVNNTNYQFIPSELNWLNTISNHEWSYYYGILPKENICTENLTPWSNLLPCRRHNGLSLLLNPSKLFSSKYQSMQVHVAPLGENKYMKMTQTFQLVFDMRDTSKIIDKIKKKPKTWDIKQIFDIKNDHMPYLKGCPVAQSSLVIFDIPEWIHSNIPSWNLKDNKQSVSIKPLPRVVYTDKRLNSHLWIYPLSTSNKVKTIKFSWPLDMFGYNRLKQNNFINPNIGVSQINYLKTERFLIEHNSISGQLVIMIKNQHLTDSIRFSYFDPLPDFLKLYFHSMDMRIDGTKIDPFTDLEYFNIEFSKYKSDVVRIRNENPICMEWVVTLSANSELRFTMNIDKKFQHFESYPPDYNRGFDIGNGIIRILDNKFNLIHYHNLFVFGDQNNNKNNNKYDGKIKIMELQKYRNVSQVIYTPQILVLLPYPDMSMVFNVIAFSSTLFAFFFGTAFNNLYRDIEDLDKRNVHFIRDKLKALFNKIYEKIPCKKKKKQEEKTDNEQTKTDENDNSDSNDSNDESDSNHD